MSGIIVGCDQNQEWMLPWWWGHYAEHNRFPVAFFDFGMSKEAQDWCRARGQLIQLPPFHPTPKEKISEKRLQEWMGQNDERMWVARSSWFQKPRAMSMSPFKKTVWLDLDCEVKKELAPLFSYGPFAAAKEFGGEALDAGVIVFEERSIVVQKWAKLCEEKSGEFLGDKDVLDFVLKTEKAQILPPIYNWRLQLGDNPDVAILHYLGSMGKEIIRMIATAGL